MESSVQLAVRLSRELPTTAMPEIVWCVNATAKEIMELYDRWYHEMDDLSFPEFIDREFWGKR